MRTVSIIDLSKDRLANVQGSGQNPRIVRCPIEECSLDPTRHMSRIVRDTARPCKYALIPA